MEKNIPLYYFYRALHLPVFWLPVLYIYLTTNKGLNPAEALLLLSLQEFLLIFLEIPTGVVADKVSRKFSIGLGNLLTSLPFLFLPFVHQFHWYVLVFAVKALGKALISGADSSLLYDTLEDLNKTHEYKSILNRSKSYMMGITALCIFLGGIIAQWNIELTILLPIPLYLLSTSAIFFMNEPETSKKAQKLQDRNYLLHTLKAIKVISKNKVLLILAVSFAITEAVALNMKWFYTPLFEALHFNLIIIGSMTTVLYVIKAVFAAINAKVLDKQQNHRNMVWFTGITSVAFFTMGTFFNGGVIIVGLLLIILFSEALLSIFDEEIHHSIQSHHRATAASVINVFSSITATIMLNGFGFFHLHQSLTAALIFVASLVAVSTILSQKLHSLHSHS